MSNILSIAEQCFKEGDQLKEVRRGTERAYENEYDRN